MHITSDRDVLEKLNKILSKGLENLSQEDLREIESLIRPLLQQIPSITRSECDKKLVVRALMSLVDELRTHVRR